MRRPLRIALLLLAVVAVVLLGVFREFVFVNINYHLKYIYYEQAESYAHSFFDFLNNYSYSAVYYSKWWLTAIFSVVYIGLTLLIIYCVYPEKRYIRWTLFTYGLLIAVSSLLFLFGWLLGDMDNLYYITRKVMGIVQSPVVAMFLIPAFRLLPVQK